MGRPPITPRLTSSQLSLLKECLDIEVILISRLGRYESCDGVLIHSSLLLREIETVLDTRQWSMVQSDTSLMEKRSEISVATQDWFDQIMPRERDRRHRRGAEKSTMVILPSALPTDLLWRNPASMARMTHPKCRQQPPWR